MWLGILQRVGVAGNVVEGGEFSGEKIRGQSSGELNRAHGQRKY